MEQRRIDFSSQRTVYRQLADIVRELIETGKWEPGRSLPSEADLGHEYEVSQSTVRKALTVLRKQGWVVRRRGRAAAVAEPREATIVQINEGDKGRISFRSPTPDEQRELRIDEDALVMVVELDGQDPVIVPVLNGEIRFGDVAE